MRVQDHRQDPGHALRAHDPDRHLTGRAALDDRVLDVDVWFLDLA
jgi:hypothetical protein